MCSKFERAELPEWGKLALNLLNSGTVSPRSNERFDDYRPYLAKLKDKRIDSLAYLSFETDAAAQRLYDKIWHIQRDTLQEAVKRCAEHGIKLLIFKGAEFLLSCFQSHSIGILFDVDVLCARDDLEELKAAMHGIGLRQAVFSKEQGHLVARDVADIARLESNHYELAPFSRTVALDLLDDEFEVAQQWNQHPIYVVGDNKAIVVVEVDVHHRVALDIDSEPLISRSIESAMPQAMTLSSGDLVWFTVSRFYTEVALNGKRSLRDFAYVAQFMRTNEVDWDLVVSAATEYEIYPSLFYFLAFMSRFDGVSVPREILTRLNPTGSTRLRDWGWQLGNLFEFVEGDPIDVAFGGNWKSPPVGLTGHFLAS